jgi:hypothetical protein
MPVPEPATPEGDGAIDDVLVSNLDVTRPDQLAAAVSTAQARFGGLRGMPSSGRSQRRSRRTGRAPATPSS